MPTRNIMTRAGIAAVLAIIATGASTAQEAPGLAVAGILYLDTSGEPTDQTEAHERRVALFRDVMAETIAASGRYRIASVTCGEAPCRTGEQELPVITDAAREAGADFVVVGAIHKLSTLVGSGRVTLLDARDDTVVLERALSFRGDTDEAFRRAAIFAAGEILEGEPDGARAASVPAE